MTVNNDKLAEPPPASPPARTAVPREMAAKFINALNAAQPYLAPLLFDRLADSNLAAMIVDVANGTATLEFSMLPKPQ